MHHPGNYTIVTKNYNGKDYVMSLTKLITDAASDISYTDETRYGIRVIPFQVALGDRSYLSRVDMDNQGFYELMEQYDEIPKTAQVTPFQFQEIYLEEARAGVTDIILVLINDKGSATYGNSLLAKELFFDEYPEYVGKVNIRSFDGGGYSSLYGAPVVEAAKLLEAGKSADDVASYLETTLPQRQIFFGMYTLRYAAKSGRIPSAAAFLGDKLNLKPIMKIYGGEVVTAGKCRGENKLISKVVDMTLEAMEPGSAYEVICGNDPKCAQEAAELMQQHLGYGPAATYRIGAVIAANSGPKVVAISFNKKAE